MHEPSNEDDDQSLFELNNALTHLKFAHGLNKNALLTERIGEVVRQLVEIIESGQKET